MHKLFRKEFVAVLSVALLTGFLAYPAHASDVYGIKHIATTERFKVPVGTRICFQTPPLKQGAKVCYVAGNGQVLHTFVKGKPIENVDGTVSYNLGFVCYKAGETGAYINLNGKPFMLKSVEVVNDSSTEGFPLSTSFGRIFANQNVEKIVVAYAGGNLEKRQTINAAQISQFMAKLAPEKLYRNCDTSLKSGWAFSVNFYLKGQKGYYSYNFGSGFYKNSGFSVSMPTGRCVEENADEVYTIIGDFYTSLK